LAQWCIVELFVYDQMWPADSAAAEAGPSALDDGELGLVPQVATTARKVIMLLLPGIRSEQFATFDAAKAKSAVPADYERLLRCVEVGCGSVESFNVRARFLLSSALRIEHGEDKAALAGKPHAATRAVVPMGILLRSRRRTKTATTSSRRRAAGTLAPRRGCLCECGR
jgi:hypothetical protein